MASYDVTDSAVKGYALIWTERAYLFRLAIFPLFIKFVCAMTVIINGFEFDFIKQSLLMLPSYFADGWVMSHLVRLIYLGQRWPFRPTGHPQNDMATLRDRAGGIMAGTVCFALIEFLKTGIVGLLYIGALPPGAVPGQTDLSAVPHPPPSTMTMVVAMGMIVVSIWVVRYFWLYIPAAAGFSGREFLRRVGGLMGSVRLLGVWMMCSIPVLFIFILVASTLLSPYQGGSIPPAVSFMMDTFRVVIVMIMTLITTAGMAYVIRNMFMDER